MGVFSRQHSGSEQYRAQRLVNMTFWQENYAFIKDVYDMRHHKMAEWMDNVEKAISRIMADKVYTSAEFKRERDNFHALCKDLERVEVKKWLRQILGILMAERAKDQKAKETELLDGLIKKHEELIPTVSKTVVMVDLYWKCYAYGDELKPHIEFLDGIMLSSTREIAPSCVENVDELIERQEKSLVQLDTKRSVVTELIDKGKLILANPDKPKFLERHVNQIEDGWEDTNQKAKDEIQKVKKKFNLEAAFDDLAKRQKIYNDTKKTIETLFDQIKNNVEVMGLTLPEDKKKNIEKEKKAVEEKLVVLTEFKETVEVVEKFCNELKTFDSSLKAIDSWMMQATKELEDIKNACDKMPPEDRVARTMDLQEDIAAKMKIIVKEIENEKNLLPQGEKIPQDAQAHKDELSRIHKYVVELQGKVKKECDLFSEDVKYWAEYKTGIKEFLPWLTGVENDSTNGLAKPSSLAEAQALSDKVHSYEAQCVDNLKVLEAANAAAVKMTTHKDADAEVAGLRERYVKVKNIADAWVKKVDTLVKEWKLLDNTVTELNAWVAKDKTEEGDNQFSLEKMESTLGELKTIFKQEESLVDNL